MAYEAAHSYNRLSDGPAPAGPVFRQAAVAELSQRALSGNDVDGLLDLATQRVCESLGVEYAGVLHQPGPGQPLVLVAGCGWSDSVRVGGITITSGDNSQAGWALRHHRPAIVEDLRTDGRFGRETLLSAHGIVSGICVAIPGGDETYGVLVAHSVRPRSFDSEDEDVLVSIANIIGSAIRNARSRAELERHAAAQEQQIRFQEAIATCARTLLSSKGEHRLERAIEALLSATQACYVFVERNVSDRELGLCSQMVAEVAAQHVHTEGIDDYWSLVPWSRMPTSRRRLERGEPFLLIPEELDGPEFEQYSLAPHPLKSELDIPIFIDDEWAGLIGFSDMETPRKWNQEDLSLLTIAATMIGAFWEREQARDSLEELIRSKDEFLATVSHELRTPLTAVVGFGEVLRDSGGKLTSEERGEFLERVVQQGTDLTNIVNDLLVAAKADIGKLQVVQVRIDLRAQAAQVLESFESDQIVNVDLSGGAVRAVGDPDRVRQIIRNFVSNALRYGGDTILVSVRSSGSMSSVIVCDNGDPIPEEDRERIFEPYERAHDAKGVTGSLGLGLAISRQLARLMGGDVTYRYADGESIFELSLPQAP